MLALISCRFTSMFGLSHPNRLINRRLSISKKEIEISQQIIPTPLSPNTVEKGHLYFVATPLGNLQDITLRAISVLSTVDIICAEDTRNTAKLLRLLNIPYKKLIAHHEHNWQQSSPELVRLLQQGKSIALVSDAGTPGISDPGAPLAAAVAGAGIPIHPVPGPSAVVSALSISGFSGSIFTFYGFLPVKGKERKMAASALMNSDHLSVFYEAPHRIRNTLELLLSLGPEHSERLVVCCRELTKLHEETFRGSLNQALAWLDRAEGVENGDQMRIRGEFTVVIAPPAPSNESGTKRIHALNDTIIDMLSKLRDDGVPRSEAVSLVGSSNSGASRSAVYRLALGMPWP